MIIQEHGHNSQKEYLLIKLINKMVNQPQIQNKNSEFSYNIIIEYTKSADDEKIISL